MTIFSLDHHSLVAKTLQMTVAAASTLLDLSPLSADSAFPARGGVPVIFPQFADHGLLPKHGFTRDLPWVLVYVAATLDGHTVTHELCIQFLTDPQWPHQARLCLTIKMSTPPACWLLEVPNMGNTSFEWTSGLHPHWYIPDLTLASLQWRIVR